MPGLFVFSFKSRVRITTKSTDITATIKHLVNPLFSMLQLLLPVGVTNNKHCYKVFYYIHLVYNYYKNDL